jgi:hypothetical protein
MTAPASLRLERYVAVEVETKSPAFSKSLIERAFGGEEDVDAALLRLIARSSLLGSMEDASGMPGEVLLISLEDWAKPTTWSKLSRERRDYVYLTLWRNADELKIKAEELARLGLAGLASRMRQTAAALYAASVALGSPSPPTAPMTLTTGHMDQAEELVAVFTGGE